MVVEERRRRRRGGGGGGGEDGRIVTCVTTFRAEKLVLCEARARSHLEVGRRVG